MVSTETALAAGHAAELGGPVDDGIGEEAAGFEIAEETGDGFIHGGAHFAVVFGEVFVAVPVAAREAVVGTGPDLDEADAAFDEASGDEAAFGHFGGDGIVEAVEFAGGGGLAGEAEDFGGAELEFSGHLVGRDAGFEAGVAFVGLEVGAVDLVEEG